MLSKSKPFFNKLKSMLYYKQNLLQNIFCKIILQSMHVAFPRQLSSYIEDNFTYDQNDKVRMLKFKKKISLGLVWSQNISPKVLTKD